MQNFHNLLRERNKMWPLCFHSASRDYPCPCGQIKFSPHRLAQFTWPDKYQRRKFQSEADDFRSLVVVYVAQQFTNLHWLGNRPEMCSPRRWQRTAQILSNISLSASGCDRISPNLPAVLVESMRRVQDAPGFNSTKYGQQNRRRNALDLFFAEPRKEIAFQPSDYFATVTIRPLRAELCKPFPGNRLDSLTLEHVGLFNRVLSLSLNGGWVSAIAQ